MRTARTPKDFWEQAFRDLAATPPAPRPSVFDTGRREADLFVSGLPTGGRVLDFGCGTGRNALALARRGFKVSVCDLAPAAVAFSRDRAAAEGLALTAVAYGPRVAGLIGVPDEWFDGIVAWSVLDHMTRADTQAAVRAFTRVLKPGGLLLLSFDPDDEESRRQPHDTLTDGTFRYTAGKWEGMLWRLYSNEEITALLSESWETISLTGASTAETRVVLARNAS